MNIQAAEFHGLVAFSDATVASIIAGHVATRPQSPAIILSKSNVLTYGALGNQIAAFGKALRANGVGPSARVAIMLPDSPDFAVAIIAIACNAVAVPLDPKLTTVELESLLTVLRINAVVISKEIDAPLREVAARLGIRLFDLASVEPGIVTISGRTGASAVTSNGMARERAARPDDLAVILRTSATTGRPKLVPVTHRNLVITEERRRFWFNFTPDDRALCVTPLYYSSGLRTLFSSLLAGGSVACPNGEADGDIIDWLADLKPTWYGAGQTFHMTVLERARAGQGAQLSHCLRFIRSGGAPLSAAVREGLEEVFGVPVLEMYGISEAGTVAAHSIAPEGRKAGTVGKPWPNEVAIRADDGKLLPPGTAGEIFIRGPSLMPGYLYNEDANSAAFVDGWFRTGDFGLIDSEGFLVLLGRLKEFINRGGEKVSPYEIERALLLHPSVHEAAAFSVPHPRLGENVVAAVVLVPGASTTPAEIKASLSEHLAPFKIPQRVFVKAELPKGPTGKVLRSQLSETAVRYTRNVVPPETLLQIFILKVWKKLLGRDDIGIDDDFIEAGGDSLLSVQMILTVESATQKQIPPSLLKYSYTIRELEAAISRGGVASAELIACAREGHGTPLLFCHGDFATRGLYAFKLAEALTGDQPVYLLHPYPNPDPKLTIEEMAAAYIPDILARFPTGALRFIGYCNGGQLAWEIAHRLGNLGRQVEFVVLVETISLNARPLLRAIGRLFRFVVAIAPKKVAEKIAREGMNYVWNKMGRFPGSTPYSQALRNYFPPRIMARLICVVCEQNRTMRGVSPAPWTNLVRKADCRYVAGTHLNDIPTLIGELAPLLNRLARVTSIALPKSPVSLT